MDYERLIRRAVNAVWEHKFLIVLGILVALGGGGGSSINFNFGGGDFNFDFGQGTQPQAPPDFPQIPELPPEAGVALGGIAVLAILLICVALVVGLVLFVVSTIARGGLIAGVDDIEEERPASLGQAWSAGWQRVWTLLGVNILPAIPAVLLAFIGVVMGLGAAGLSQMFGPRVAVGGAVAALLIPLACVLIPIALVLTLLRTFANRAAMLEGLGVIASYGRGWSVLLDNIGSAFVLFLLQILINVVVSLLLLPFAILLCLFWPLMFVLQGALAAVFSTLWTLAWREWTGAGEIKVKAAPVA